MSRHNVVEVDPTIAPPGPRGYPLIGVLPMLLRDPLQLFTDAVKQFGDVVCMRVGGQRFFLLNHPNYLKHVLQDNHRNYQKGASFKKLKRLLGEGLTTSEGDFWLRQRRLVQPAFHHQRLAAMATTMTDAATDLVERWKPLAARGAPLDVSNEMMSLTQQIIVRTMFGSAISHQDADDVCESLDTALKHLSSSLWLSTLPDRLMPGNRRFEQALALLNSIVYRIIEDRRRSGDDPGDLLSMLLQARDAETGESMDDRQLRDESMNIFLAGHETTAIALTWVFFMLAQNPDVEQRLHAELAAVLGSRTPTFEDLPHLNYTRMVIEEVLRLYPPAWSIFRSPVDDDEIGGYHIPAGSVVVMCPYTIQRSPAFWEQPERFDPERFLPERSNNRPRFAYTPFGGGPRQCIGNSFAMMEAQLILATLAQRYQLRSIPGQSIKPFIAVVLRPNPEARLTLHVRPDQV